MAKRCYKRKPFKPVDYERFKETRLLAGMTRKQAAQLLFVTLRTVQLWEAGKVQIPYAAFRLLRIHTGYELPGRAWRGFMLLRESLISPEGKSFSPADLSYLSLTFSMARLWRKEYESRKGRKEASGRAGAAAAAASLTLVKGGKQ